MEKLPGHRTNTWIYYDKDGHIYTIDRCTQTKRYYRCRDKSCPGRATTLPAEGSPILRSHPHSHAASSSRLVTTPFLEELKRLASTDSRRLPDVYRDVARKFPEAAQLVTYRNVESRLRRLRQGAVAAPGRRALSVRVTVQTEPPGAASLAHEPSGMRGSEVSAPVHVVRARDSDSSSPAALVQQNNNVPGALVQDNSVRSDVDCKLVPDCIEQSSEVPSHQAPHESEAIVGILDRIRQSNSECELAVTELRSVGPCDGIKTFSHTHLPDGSAPPGEVVAVPPRDSQGESAGALCSLPPEVPAAAASVGWSRGESLDIKGEMVSSESILGPGLPEDTSWCPDCGTSFGEMVLLRTHVCVRDPAAVSCCARALDNHLVLQTTYACDACQVRFTLHTSLMRHMRVHSGERCFKCCFCHKSFSQKGHCKTHEFTHSTEKPYVCDECGKSFACKMSLKRHIFAHMGIRPHICATCDKGYPTRAALLVHRTTHSRERPFICEMCGKTFTLRGNLKDHRRIHSAERPFMCDKCPKTFRRKSTLKAHRLTHDGYRRFFCDECGEFFTNKNAFTVHKLAHRDIKAFECTVCGKDFTKKRFLDAHGTLHGGRKAHRCPLCGKTFAYKETLKRHALSHSDERAFTCDVCGKQFALKCLLAKHSIVHTDLKPFGCDICGKFFAQKGNLTAHYKLHSGARPFACSQCGRSFMRESHLRNHLKAHLAGTVRIRKLVHNSCCS